MYEIKGPGLKSVKKQRNKERKETKEETKKAAERNKERMKEMAGICQSSSSSNFRVSQGKKKVTLQDQICPSLVC